MLEHLFTAFKFNGVFSQSLKFIFIFIFCAIEIRIFLEC